MKRGILAIMLLTASSFLLAAETSPVFGRKLGKTQKIKRYGYSIRPPANWNSTPQRPGKTRVVGSWEPDAKDIEKRYDLASVGAELKIVRFPAKGAVTGKKFGKEERKEKKRVKRALKRFGLSVENAESLEDYVEARWEGAGKRYVPKKITAGKGSKKLIGKFIEFTSGRSYVCGALFKTPQYEWGVFYLSPEDYYKKQWQKLFFKSIQTFKVYKKIKEAPTVADASGNKKKLTGEAKRKSIHEGIAGNPGWWAHDTENYVFLTNSTKKSFIRQLGKEIEILRRRVYEKYFPPTNKIDVVCIVRVFSDQSEYHQYGGPSGSAGYWSSTHEELVLFDGFQGVSKSKSKRFTKSVMYHEAFHQYIHFAVGDLAPHSWFNEGHGDFFAGHKISGNKVTARPFDWRIDYLKRHRQQKKNLIPIRSLVRLPQREYYSNAGLKYSQGWALIYYLRNVTKKKLWRSAPDRYFAYLRDNIAAFKQSKKDDDDTKGESIPGIPGVKIYNFEDEEKVARILSKAVDKGFEGIDYEKLDKAFQKWVETLR